MKPLHVILLSFILGLLFCVISNGAEADLHPAAKYGHPSEGRLLVRDGYLAGHDGWYKSARWTLYRIEPFQSGVEREDEFREDPEVDPEHRSAVSDYVGVVLSSGDSVDRGHLVPSNDLRQTRVANSDTFLMSNISPQESSFNRGVWKRTEYLVRQLSSQPEVRECYVAAGPCIAPDETGKAVIQYIGETPLPVPTHYWKSVLIVGRNGKLKMWSVILPNRKIESDVELEAFAVTVDEVEKVSGLDLWSRLAPDIQTELESTTASWKL